MQDTRCVWMYRSSDADRVLHDMCRRMQEARNGFPAIRYSHLLSLDSSMQGVGKLAVHWIRSPREDK